jgi:hypothetical protein
MDIWLVFYGNYKVIANVLENTNTIFTLCEHHNISINHHFSTHDK